MVKISRLFIALVVECWVLLESLLHKAGLERFSATLYSKFCKRSPSFFRIYSFFVSSFYRRSYFDFEVEEDLVFLDCFWGRKVGDHPYAIYREILKDTTRSWRFVWVKNADIIAPKDVEGNPNVTFVEHGSIGYAVALLKAGFLICNSNFSPYFSRRDKQVFINTWHGIPLKTLGLDAPGPLLASVNTQRNFIQATFIPMPSRWAAENIVGAYGAELAKDRVFELGSPRIDLMLNADVRKIREHLAVPSDRKIILYAPTWRGGAAGLIKKSISDQIEVINTIKYSTSGEYLLYVSLHHLTRQVLGEKPAGVNYVPDDVDISEFLSVVDILVSDYSSIFIDYLVLDRPVVLHVPDLERYQEERGLLFDVNELPVSVTFENKDLIDITKTAKRPSLFSSFNRFKSLWLPREDGEAARRCWEMVGEHLEASSIGTRKNVLVYGGMLENNGVTQSLLNLIESADKDVYRFWVIFNANCGVPGSAGHHNYLKVKKSAEVILVPNSSRMVFTEYLAAGFFKYSRICLFSAFKRRLKSYACYESRRLLADVYFEFYIDFTGYSYLWSLLAPYINAGKRAVYLHSDMYEEWKNADRGMSQLGAIFRNYKNYDYLVSVSTACHEQNNIKLAPFVSGKAKSVAVPNSFNGNGIVELSRYGLAEISASTAAFLQQFPTATVFITVSRLSPEKNLSVLLRAFKKLRDAREDVLLVIVGDGKERKKLEREAADLGVMGAVHFSGFMANPYPLLLAADCLVFPSKYEGQGLVLLEALALEKYCIATDMPATREILRDGYGGLVEPTSEAFFRALLFYCRARPSAKLFDHNAYSQDATQQFNALMSGQLDYQLPSRAKAVGE